MLPIRSKRIALPLLLSVLLVIAVPSFHLQISALSSGSDHHRPVSSAQMAPSPSIVGGSRGGTDEVLQSSGIITTAVGTFPSVSGLTGESDSLCGDTAHLCGDTYSLQVNTNTFACNTPFTDNNPVGTDPVTKALGLACWEQFIFHYDPTSCPFGNCDGNLFIQYWLINYLVPGSGYTSCPSTDIPGGGVLADNDWAPGGPPGGPPVSCFASSDTADTDSISIQSLASVDLVGSAGSGGDCAVFNNGSGDGPWQLCVGQSVLNLYLNWNAAEFNVFGFANSSQANFNPGTSITVETDAIQQGNSPSPVACNFGSFTGETNNLNIVSPCKRGPGIAANSQGITFTESTFSFSILASPVDDTVLRGQSGAYTVTVTQTSGPPDPNPVTLSVSNGLPGGASFSGGPVVATVAGTSVTFTVTTTGTGPLGTFQLTIQGSVGSLTNSAIVNLHIYDFTVTAVPMSLQILTTGSNTYSVSVSLVSGSSTFGLPNIGLSVAKLPFGTTASFSQLSGTPNFSSILTITTSNAPSGPYTLTLAGTDNRTPEGGSRNTSPVLIILTPAQALPLVIGTLISLRSSGGLGLGQAGSLIMKAQLSIDDLTENPSANPAACNLLGAFVNQVESYVSDGVLTHAQANMLLSGPLGISAIMASVPC